jgi:hypothetical protein
VDKNRTAPTCDAGSGVVIELYDEVVKPVVSPQTIPLLIWTPLDRIIIPAMLGIFDPCVVWLDGLRWQQGWRMRKAVGAPPKAHRVEFAARRCPVTFSLVCGNA